MTPPLRRIVANLHCEEEWAAAATGRRPHSLPRQALETAAGAGTLLRVFAQPGDRLWLPAPIEAERLAKIPGLPLPEIDTGPLKSLKPADDILAWAETPAVALHREGGGSLSRAPARGRAGEGASRLHEILWHLRPPSPEVAAAVHHRSFCLQVAKDLGLALPGARMLESMADLEHTLSAPGAPRSWVVKAPLSAAGRDRHIGSTLDDPATRRAVEGLFRRHSPLLFEPWMDRTDDFGCVALLLPDGSVRPVSFHRQIIDRRGQFLGIELGSRFQGFEGLDREEQARMEVALEGTARALREVGYRGPFGIDAWRYRNSDGSTSFHPLGEINARMTFGLVARALVDRLGEALPLDGSIQLRLGREIPKDQAAVVPLLLPGHGGSLAAWLQKANPRH